MDLTTQKEGNAAKCGAFCEFSDALSGQIGHIFADGEMALIWRKTGLKSAASTLFGLFHSISVPFHRQIRPVYEFTA